MFICTHGADNTTWAPVLPILRELVEKELLSSSTPPALTRRPGPPALPIPEELVVETEPKLSPAPPPLTRLPGPPALPAP